MNTTTKKFDTLKNKTSPPQAKMADEILFADTYVGRLDARQGARDAGKCDVRKARARESRMR